MNRAFTLIELILVMSLLSITALLFISYTGDVGDASVDALSRKIQSDIRYAQQLSTSTSVTHGVKFVSGGNYTVYSGTIATPVADPLDKQAMVEDMGTFGNINIVNNFTVEFNKLGTPTTGGGGYVEVVADSGASRRIYVIENTGAVIVDVYNYGQGCSCRLCEVDRR